MRNILRHLGFLSFAAVLILKVLTLTESAGWLRPDIQSVLRLIDVIATVLIFAISAYLQRVEASRVPGIRADDRSILIETVRTNWIEGVLNETLRDAKFNIPIATRVNHVGDARFQEYSMPVDHHDRPTALKYLLSAVFRRKSKRQPLTNIAEAIPQIFHNASEKLLILGAPGSGKTVLLLELASALLSEACDDINKSVPVILNLSSWSFGRQSLDRWLTEELKRNYGINRSLAKDLIGSDSLIYLLDGLDEVAEDVREDCLKAINAFIAAPKQIVICSRVDEYDSLSIKLSAHNAIELLPLEKQQVANVLRRYLPSDKAKDIMRFIAADEAVWPEVNRPLFINILISTYVSGKPFSPQMFESGAESHIRQLIVEPFVLQRLRNNPDFRYSNNETLYYLAWLGHNLAIRNLSQFNIEMVQGDWLSTRRPEMNSNWSFQPLLSRITVDLGWKFEYVGFRKHGCRQTVTTIVKKVLPGKKPALVLAIIYLILILNGTSVAFIIGTVVAKVFFDVLALLVNDLWPFGSRRITQRSSINPGFGDAFKEGLSIMFVFSIGCGIIGSFFMTVFALSELFIEAGQILPAVTDISRVIGTAILNGFVLVFKYGFLFGLAINVIFGPWSNILKHVLLRMILWRKGVAPGRYDRFLQMVVNRRLMRRVGGSVLFVHRYVLEYFADQWEHELKSDYEHKRQM